MNNSSFRIIDANINRVSEGIRVIEDVVRFNFANEKLTENLRNTRHVLRKLFNNEKKSLLLFRDSDKDIGKKISQNSCADKKKDMESMAVANFKRIQEGLRVIEEICKTCGYYGKGKTVEQIRFEFYTIEKEFSGFFKKKLPSGIYGITAEKFSRGRTNICVVREMVKAGVSVIQYREKYKYKTSKQILNECYEIRKITNDYNVVFIVNDYIDIAMIVEADGVHLGQDDIDIKDARKILDNKIVGISTHSKKQAQKAVEEGADYIGVGPIYSTKTKENVCDPVGLQYLEYVVSDILIPFVAIGGIKEYNIEQVIRAGAETVSLVTEITGADDIGLKVKKIKALMDKARAK